MKNLSQLQLEGDYTVFYPNVTGRKRDTVKEVIKKMFGESTKVFFHDEEVVSIFSNSENTMAVPSAVIGVPLPVATPIVKVEQEKAGDKYMKEKGVVVSKNEGRAAGW